MTKISDLLLSWRTRRARHFIYNDAISFRAFRNYLPSNNGTPIKESSLINAENTISEINKNNEYVRFSEEDSNNINRYKCSRPSIITITLLVLLMAVFLILPLIYLLHCFGILTAKHEFLNTHLHNYGINKDKEHYMPSVQVHQKLDNDLFKSKSYENYNLPPSPKPNYKQCRLLKDEDKFDCYPEAGANLNSCEKRGCCWLPSKIKLNYEQMVNSTLNVPYCYYPPNYESYKYVNVTETGYGLTAFLKRNYQSSYPGDVEIIKMIVKYESENRLHIKFVDPLNNRFEPPYPEVPIVDKATKNYSYHLVLATESTGFKVIRKLDNTTIFDSYNLGNMIFSDQFLQISAKLPSSYIYGLGEHRSNLKLSTDWQRFTMFNHDSIPIEDKNLYGSHPFYLSIEPSGNSHGVFLLNSNAMDVILQPTPAITFRTIGGILDLYFFLGPSPSQVVNQYTEVVGKPYFPPYWSLGFHLCRFGYKTLNETRMVLQRNIDAGIPIDTQWNDLDYMDSSNDFTYDKIKFRELPAFVKELHHNGMHYIPLIDAGISASEKKGQYFPYEKGVEMDIFVKNSTGQIFVGKVWNRESTVWPDFTHPRTVDYWILMLKTFHELFQFDGAWIDMNEPSNFLSGSFSGCPNSPLETPPYLPAVDGGKLNYKTICMTARQFGGLHYDVHNLYGLTEAIVTSFALAEIRRKRPVVISRSSFPGLGHYTGHWSGDVYSKWKDMQFSVPQLLSFSIFGIPLMGADICGFNGNTTQALCNRWMQLGAFYPFSRNHNTDDGIPQDPAALGPEVIASSKKALKIRYSLLPYLYTLFWKAHIQGETVARPLFFEFINDINTYSIDDQFLWGAAIMFVPILEEGSTTVFPYLPAGTWYDYYTRTAIKSTGQKFNISAPLDTIPIFLRGGYIIPQQSSLPTTTQSRLSKIQLLAVSDSSEQGSGQLYWDDGDSLNTVEERQYSLFKFTLESGKLQSEPVWLGPEIPPNLGLLTVLGVNRSISEVTVNQVAQAFRYDTINKVLVKS